MDPALVGCFRFEDTTDDASAAGLEVSAVAVGFTPGVSGRAAVFTGESVLRVAETPALDLDAFTIEMWVRPDGLPVGSARAGLFDNDLQYGLFLYEGGRVRCTGSGEVEQDAVLAIGAWSHVACVHDGQSISLHIDGRVRATSPASAPGDGGDDGSNIGGNSPGGGDHFIGRIDELRIFRRARTPAEICEAAGCVAGDRIPEAR